MRQKINNSSLPEDWTYIRIRRTVKERLDEAAEQDERSATMYLDRLLRNSLGVKKKKDSVKES